MRYWLLGEVLYFINDKGLKLEQLHLSAEQFARFVTVAASDRLNRQSAKVIFEEMIFCEGDFDIEAYIREHDLEQVNDQALIQETVRQVIADNPKTVEQYRAGQTKVMGFSSARPSSAFPAKQSRKRSTLM